MTFVIGSERVPPSESKGPPKNRSSPSRAARLRTCGDLSTRSRTHSLKVTWMVDFEHTNFWRPPGRAVLGVFLIERSHATNTCRKTPRGATPAAHRPGAPLDATRQAAGVPWARSQFPPATLARPRRWGDAGPAAAPAAADQKAGAPGRRHSDSSQVQRSGSAVGNQDLNVFDSTAEPRDRHTLATGGGHLEW